jgi:hypothetical protein
MDNNNKASINTTKNITYFQLKHSSKQSQKFVRNIYTADLNLVMSYDNCLRVTGR